MASAESPDGCAYEYKVAPPSSSELSRQLTDECGYPEEDVTNLQRVSLYYQFRQGGSRFGLVDAINTRITDPKFKPSPALHMLAALPFPIVITTNYDHLFDQALRRAKTVDGNSFKDPILL